MSNSVQPHRPQPTRLPRPWDSPGKKTGVGCHFLLQCMKVKSESEVVRPSETSWTAAFQAPPSMGFSRQECWSGVPLPSPNGLAGVGKVWPRYYCWKCLVVFIKKCFQKNHWKCLSITSHGLQPGNGCVPRFVGPGVRVRASA